MMLGSQRKLKSVISRMILAVSVLYITKRTFVITKKTVLSIDSQLRRTVRTADGVLTKVRQGGEMSSAGAIEAEERTVDVNITNNYMVCPVGWPLEIIPETKSPSQVCRNSAGTGQWICATGWEQLSHPPYCQKKHLGSECSAVSDKRKLLFINIPQAGGLSIDQSKLFDDARQRNNCHSNHRHGIQAFDAEAYKSYHKFTMVRHPCSRLISLWRQFSRRMYNDDKMKTWVELHMDRDSILSFTSFVENVLYPGGDVHIENEEYLQSQVMSLVTKEKQFGIDQVLHYETWNRSIEQLAKHLKSDPILLQAQLQPMGPDESCIEMYTDSTWSKMRWLYAIDFCVLGYPSNIDEVYNVPTNQLDSEAFTARYRKCREEITSSSLSFIDNFYKKEQINKNCFIYTYFVLTPDSTPEQKLEKEEVLAVWKMAWASKGWIPRILSEDNAKSHPAYKKYREAFWSYPRVHGREYGYNNLIRHLAMANVGGGWMADSDVLPLRLPGCTEPMNNGAFTVYQRFIPGLVSGNASEYFRVATMMATVDWKGSPHIFSIEDKDHVSDMYCLLKFMRDGSIKTESNVETAQRIFRTPFHCNNTLMTRKYQSSLRERGWTTLPVAAHFSYDALQTIKTKDPSMLDQIWDSHKGPENVSKLTNSRAFVMKLAHEFFQKMCAT